MDVFSFLVIDGLDQILGELFFYRKNADVVHFYTSLQINGFTAGTSPPGGIKPAVGNSREIFVVREGCWRFHSNIPDDKEDL